MAIAVIHDTTMHNKKHVPIDVAKLLNGFFLRDRNSETELFEVLPRLAKNTIRRFYPDADNFKREEVLNEILYRLCELRERKTLPVIKKAIPFLHGIILNAITKVRSLYRSPGQKSRTTRDTCNVDRITSPVDVDSVATKLVAPSIIEESTEVKLILSCASLRIREALLLIFFQGFTVQLAAAKIGVNRFLLSREIEKFSLKFQVK